MFNKENTGRLLTRCYNKPHSNCLKFNVGLQPSSAKKSRIFKFPSNKDASLIAVYSRVVEKS